MDIENKKNLLELTIKIFFKHQLQIKMLHFQTKNYGTHKATDSYLSNFEEKLDKFMEVAQGIFGKLSLQNIDIKIEIPTDNSISQDLDKFIITLKGYSKIISNYPELLNIRDEIVADAEQFKYLLTFK
jgi:hypothetical protein